MTDASLPQGWPCREDNPLLPLHCGGGEQGAEADEPAHGGRIVLLSPGHGAARLEIARCPAEGRLSLQLNEPFQSECCGDSYGCTGKRTQAILSPRAPLSPQSCKAERGAGTHGGRGSCSLEDLLQYTSQKRGEGVGRERGRRRISRHRWVHSSPAYASQSYHRCGGDERGGGWPWLRQDSPFRRACVSHPALRMDMPVSELLRNPPRQCLTVPVRHPLPVPAKSAGSGMTLFFLDA